jgi:hypothetical protein
MLLITNVGLVQIFGVLDLLVETTDNNGLEHLVIIS